MKTVVQAQITDARTIETLNGLLKGEIAASETYTQAIRKMNDQRVVPLQDSLDCHARRAVALHSRIIALGGTPAQGSGVWGTFARLVEASAAFLGHEAAIAALEEGEDHGLRDYRAALATVDGRTRAWLEEDLLPAQIRTHAVMVNARGPGSGPPAGSTGVIPTMLMAAVISFGALAAIGCQDERKVGINDVTPDARSTITKLAGSDVVTSIEEVTTSEQDVSYRVVVTRDSKVERYTVDGYGLLRD
ncbi:MAG TPA: DUF2383 domain-containing protein [Planctomycetota bacterium]|nr:DUF2383 domain-containing protein [Planctomycetota bacterium]